jgi:hypothetical protein
MWAARTETPSQLWNPAVKLHASKDLLLGFTHTLIGQPNNQGT